MLKILPQSPPPPPPPPKKRFEDVKYAYQLEICWINNEKLVNSITFQSNHKNAIG